MARPRWQATLCEHLAKIPSTLPGPRPPSLSGSSLGARGRCGPPLWGVLRACCEGSWKKHARGSQGSKEPGGLTGWRPCAPVSGFKSFSLTSVELQMLTNSCVKLQTVHSIPLTINKEGGLPPPRTLQAAVPFCCWRCPGAGDLRARACVCSCLRLPGVDGTSRGDPGDQRVGPESRAAPQTLCAPVWPCFPSPHPPPRVVVPHLRSLLHSCTRARTQERALHTAPHPRAVLPAPLLS